MLLCLSRLCFYPSVICESSERRSVRLQLTEAWILCQGAAWHATSVRDPFRSWEAKEDRFFSVPLKSKDDKQHESNSSNTHFSVLGLVPSKPFEQHLPATASGFG